MCFLKEKRGSSFNEAEGGRGHESDPFLWTPACQRGESDGGLAHPQDVYGPKRACIFEQGTEGGGMYFAPPTEKGV